MSVAYGICALIGLFELFRAVKLHETPMFFACVAASVLYYVNIALKMTFVSYVWITGMMIVLFIIYVSCYPKYDFSDIAKSFLFFVYVPVMLSFIVFSARLDGGNYLVALIYLSTWGSDTLAYCTGMLFGRHKLTPELSPKKSIEGAFGGAIGSSVMGALFGAVCYYFFGAALRIIVYYAVTAMICGIISEFGDLTASGIKRNNDIKDFGNLIPGHGGIMDRFDSVIIVAPIIYYAALYFSF